jgi:tRNA pseudouridine55 synthase
MDGVLVVDKEQGWTSHDVVARIRKLFHQKKVGHTGTLDPMAVGVLVVCLGRATRIIRFLDSEEKAYSAEIRLGITTDTFDAEGEVTEESREQ